MTSTAMSAFSTAGQTIDVTPAGTVVPLPDEQTARGFTPNARNTGFVVPEDGTYLLTYHIAPSEATTVTASILRNNALLEGSEITPAAAADSYNLTMLARLAANDTISLQLSGQNTAVKLQGGNGASLTAVRLS